MKDYDEIADEVLAELNTRPYVIDKTTQVAAIIRKHDEAKAGGECLTELVERIDRMHADMITALYDWHGDPEYEVTEAMRKQMNNKYLTSASIEIRRFFAAHRPAPTDEKALRDLLIEARQFVGWHASGQDLYKQISEFLAREAPKDESKEKRKPNLRDYDFDDLADYDIGESKEGGV